MLENNQKKNYIRWTIMGCALICFGVIASQVVQNPVIAFDETIRFWVYEQRSPFLSAIFIPVTYMGNWQTITVLAAILILIPKTRRTIGLPFAVISLSSTVVYKVVKDIFERPRPELDVRLIPQGGFSFPSGHSMNCIVCFGILIYLIRRYCPNRKVANVLTVLLALLIIGIGTSRVYVGVHFPTDVLGGWSLGLAFLMGSILILEKIRGEK
ncbi:MAG: phosphatase PAP2 family protein [Firmicutes bacterium]|nr:phosphatase PAP2 family protein [Bacillota bacterium]